MKMSDDQFVNDAGVENGSSTEDANNFNNASSSEDNGESFMATETSQPEATSDEAAKETEVTTDAADSTETAKPAETNGTAKPKIDKKNLQPECFRKVFVGSLNYTTTEETMREHFGKFGDIVDCVIMKESKSGKSRGFGFVTYMNQAMVDEMMKSRPHKLDGRELETKRATPREEAGKPGAETSTKKLFVGAIKEGLTEEHLKEYFGKYGTIEDCIVMKDKESGKPRGFGFVSFDDYDPIDKIVLEKNHTVNNQAVAVKKALPKDQTVSGRNQNGNNNNNNHNGNFNNNRNGGNRNNHNGNNRGGGNFNRNNNNNRGNFNRNNNNNNNDEFNNNSFNDNNGGFNNFSNDGGGNFNGNSNSNGNGPNGNYNPNGSFNFALIAQKMLQAANMNPQNGGGNGGNNNFQNGNNFNGMNGAGGQMNGNNRGRSGGPMRAGGHRGGQRGNAGPYQNKQKQQQQN